MVSKYFSSFSCSVFPGFFWGGGGGGRVGVLHTVHVLLV